MTDPDADVRIESRVLLDGLIDAVLIADHAGVIRYANPAVARLLKTDVSDLRGRPLTMIIPERLRQQHMAGLARYLSSGTPHLIGGAPVRLPVLRADGTEIDIDLSLSAHRTDDGEEVFLGTLRDLGDRIELERQRAIASYLGTSREVMTRLVTGPEPITVEDAAPVLLATLGEGLGWDGGSVWTFDLDRRELRAIATWSANGDDLAAVMTRGVVMQVGEGLPGTVALAAEPSWIETVSTESIFIRQERARDVGVRSCFAFPVFVGGEVHAVVEMYSRAPQGPEPELLAILQAAGLEIGRHLERAQARRHLVEMAEALQSSLLPPLSPVVPGLDVAVRYRASGGAGQIGGDFFDVFPLPDGAWAVLIGDVSGRGPRAAALTALARYTLRAAAIGAESPRAVLAMLNDVVRRELETAYEGDERFLTVAYLTIVPNPDGLEVRIACGGHPFPLARRADGTVEEVRCQGDLIGAFDVHESRDEAVQLRPDDMLVLVTDGVLEARHEQQEFGVDGLRAVLSSPHVSDASGLADSIEEAVLDHLGGNGQDDLAIVVLRLPPALEDASSSTIDVQVAELNV
ncbi:MAG TPA: SpoIIE family protein phosphatase [Acidimicrobiales bacterium]|nr:SpoIIE family protein phosphatase [Acidimicrobiales bacterium]